jgi:predicted NBD/HSP70 family sugar kinase
MSMSGLSDIAKLLPLVDRLKPRAQQVAVVALIAVGIALIWAIATGAVHAQAIVILAPSGALVVLGFILLLVAASGWLFAKEPSEPTVAAIAAPGGELVLGCWFGRTGVLCGALQVSGAPGPAVPRCDRISTLGEVKALELSAADRNSSRAYDSLAHVILDCLHALQRSNMLGSARISSMGIGTPGLIDLQSGTLTLTVTVPDTNVPREVARRLLQSDRHGIRAVFEGEPETEAAFVDHIYVDNDVRCVARYVLADHGWPEFVCVYVGRGIGGALAFNGRVHYGAHGSAGHIGHIDIGQGVIRRLPVRAGLELEPVKCDCGKVGFHLEPLANFRGLERIARAVAEVNNYEVLAELLELHSRNGDSDSFFFNVFPALLGSASGRPVGELPVAIRQAAADNPAVNEYANAVLRTYVAVLAAGIATLTNILDFERVVLCGPLVEQLRQNDLFSQCRRELLPNHLLDPGARPTVHDVTVREALWRGAALIGWDSSYHKHRNAPSNK